MKHLLALLLLVVLIAGGAAAWMWYGMTHPYQGFSREGVFVDVPRGVSRRYVAYILKSGVHPEKKWGGAQQAGFRDLRAAASEAHPSGRRILF